MMKILPFDESLSHREILPYRDLYKSLFKKVKKHVESKISHIQLIHIGSTAVPDLRGKPMLDIIAISESQNLRAIQQEFESIDFHRRDVWTDCDDKPYVCGSFLYNSERFNINIHICNSSHAVLRDALKFMTQLNNSTEARREYETAKDRAHRIDPSNPEIYNREKEAVIIKIQETHDEA